VHWPLAAVFVCVRSTPVFLRCAIARQVKGPRLAVVLIAEIVALIKGFPYYVRMNITLSLDSELVRRLRKIAVERDTTLTGMVREYLENVAAEEGARGRQRRERQRLERTFEEFQFKIGKRSWKRQDLYARS